MISNRETRTFPSEGYVKKKVDDEQNSCSSDAEFSAAPMLIGGNYNCISIYSRGNLREKEDNRKLNK